MGTPFLRRYVIMGSIGHGGVSVVYQAFDTLHARQTAIKMLDPRLAGEEHARKRICREALITDRMRHPSVPEIYEFGDAPLPDGSVVPYVVMELLTGTVLAGRLADGALPWPEAVRVAATIADVLVVAHRRGVVHRDLSPANIMLTAAGAKIIDFGVAVTVEAPTAGDGPFVLPPSRRFATTSPGRANPPTTCTPSACCCTRWSPGARRIRPVSPARASSRLRCASSHQPPCSPSRGYLARSRRSAAPAWLNGRPTARGPARSRWRCGL